MPSFGRFELQPERRCLLQDGNPVAIGARAFDVLLALAERRERIVTKAELLDLVWPDLVVEENNLQVQISTLRKLLGPGVISTIPGRGYRFVASANVAGEAHTGEEPVPIEDGPLLLPVCEIRHSLPAESDAFVGRIAALAELSCQFQSGARLVSVLGIGGSGKTRLVMRYGRSWLGQFPGGVWFCDLAPARSVDGIVSAVAQGLDVPLGRDDPVVQLGYAIAGRGACLVILDNFEQVASHAARTLGHWLTHADQARFIVTTREVLGVPGEVVLAVPPLDPAEGAALFVQRAEAARSDFRPGADDQLAIAKLVALLDGLPLAIELAAARVRVMPPRLLLLRMGERFKLLASKSGRLDRQLTLRAAFDWSWDLLPPHEKAALAQLSVFEGGFTLEAAEAVIDLAAFEDAPWTVDAVHALVDKSFVRPRGDDRFDLLVSVQVYAAEHLQTEGRYTGSGLQAMTAAQMRAIAWFAALGPIRAVEGRCADLDNLVTACRRAVTLADGDSAAGALGGAWRAIGLRGPFEAGVELAESVCAMQGLNDRAAAHAHLALGQALVACGRLGLACAAYGRALVCSRASGDRLCEARVRYRLGSVHADKGAIDEARSHFGAAMQMARKLGERQLEAQAMSLLGMVEARVGHTDEALLQYEQALSLARESGDPSLRDHLSTLGGIASLYLKLGRLDEAKARCLEILSIARDSGNRWAEGMSLCTLGSVYLGQDCLSDAEVASEAALVVGRELGNLYLEWAALFSLGDVSGRLGRAEEAQTHFQAAARLAHTIGDLSSESQSLESLGLLHARHGRHGEARDALESAEALLQGEPYLPRMGLLVISRAEAQYLAGDAAAATASLAAASAIATQVGAGPSSEISLELARVSTLMASART